MSKEEGTAQPNTNQTNAGSRGIPPTVHQFLAAAEVLDNGIRLGHTDVLGSVVTSRHANKKNGDRRLKPSALYPRHKTSVWCSERRER
jgi:hypothetical protein